MTSTDQLRSLNVHVSKLDRDALQYVAQLTGLTELSLRSDFYGDSHAIKWVPCVSVLEPACCLPIASLSFRLETA